MINNRKVRLMTRTAIYEKHEGLEDLPKAKNYKGDYVSLHMWTTAIAVTISYFLILLLIIACNFESIIENLTEFNYWVLGIILVVAYVTMLMVFLMVAYFVYTFRYEKAEHGIKVYQSRLHKIFLMNKADKKQKGGIS